jgi:integrase
MIGQAPLSDLLPLDIQKFYDHKFNDGKLKAVGGLSNRSVTYIHSILNQALAKAVDLEMIEKNPCDKVKPGKDKRKQRKGQDIVSLSKEELNEFIKDSREHRDFALIYTAAYTGARQSELLGLKWDDVNWEEKTLYIHMALDRHSDGSYEHRPRTKNYSSTRTISVTDADLAVLKQHRKNQNELQLAAGSGWKNTFNLVFTEADGSPMDRRNQTSRFINLANKLLSPPKIKEPKTVESEVKPEKLPEVKTKHLTFHGLRHTHATILLSDGEYINVVS